MESAIEPEGERLMVGRELEAIRFKAVCLKSKQSEREQAKGGRACRE